jgi:hypothetical protein
MCLTVPLSLRSILVRTAVREDDVRIEREDVYQHVRAVTLQLMMFWSSLTVSGCHRLEGAWLVWVE